VAPTVGPAGSGEESGASIPDFSGVWDHGIPGFEPLASGPTALVNRSRLPNGKSNPSQLVGDYTNPILKPEAAEVVKKYGELELNGIGSQTPRNQCWPGGLPFDFIATPMQLVQTANQVIILYIFDHQVRHVRMN
jgi:hypothetical protein